MMVWKNDRNAVDLHAAQFWYPSDKTGETSVVLMCGREVQVPECFADFTLRMIEAQKTAGGN